MALDIDILLISAFNINILLLISALGYLYVIDTGTNIYVQILVCLKKKNSGIILGRYMCFALQYYYPIQFGVEICTLPWGGPILIHRSYCPHFLCYHIPSVEQASGTCLQGPGSSGSSSSTLLYSTSFNSRPDLEPYTRDPYFIYSYPKAIPTLA